MSQGGIAVITSISFENFRGFRSTSFNDMAQITLIAGRNNAGKSSMLEGIFLMLDHASPKSFPDINRFRVLPDSTDPSDLWVPAFYDLKADIPIKISMQFKGSPYSLEYSKDHSFVPSGDNKLIGRFVSSARSSYTLKFHFIHGQYEEVGHFTASPEGIMFNLNTTLENNQIKSIAHAQFINSLTTNFDAAILEWFGKLELDDNKKQLIDAVRIIEPETEDVRTIVQNGHIQLYVKTKLRLMPIKLAGDGMNRLLYILLSMISNPGAVILIDEIETGFYYAVYEKIWETIASTARAYGCQVIATTHSHECIMGAMAGIERAGMQDAFSYIRIDREDDDRISTHRFDFKKLSTAASANWEVR